MLEQFMKSCSLQEELPICHGRDPILEQVKSMRIPPLKEEEVAETTCDELTTTHIPCPLAPLVGEKAEKLGVKLNLGRGRGKMFLRF